MSNKQKKYHIYVNYFIQNDSWESISHPNLFVLPQEFTNLNDVKAKMVYDNFPLINKQSFYLRFFLDDKTQGVKGWVDFPPNAVIPIYNEGHVYVKVLRLPKGTKINFKNQDIYKPKDTSRVNKGNSPNLIFMDDQKNPPKQPMAQPQTSSGFDQNMFSELNKEFSNLGNFNQNSNGAQVPPPEPQQQQPKANEKQNNSNTLNIDDWGAFTGNNGSAGGVNMDSGSQSNSTNDMNKVDPNLFNVFSNMSNTPSQPANQAPGFDFTANNNNNGKMYPIDKVPSDLSEDEIKQNVDPIIMKWTLGGEGKKNLLFLLTTLNEVWTNSSTLDPPDMQTLVNDKSAVRTFYKKAMRELHADKNRDKDFKTRYIASSLYQILNEANSNY